MSKIADRYAVIKARPLIERQATIKGRDHLSNSRTGLIHGFDHPSTDRYSILRALTYTEAGGVTMPKPMAECGALMRAVETLPPGRTKRLTLLDTLSLRTTSVYRAPRAISTLQIVYGDLALSRIPCTPLDKDGRLYHASDIPMQEISRVYVDGEEKTFGVKVWPAYQDETGRAIAAVVFDEPQYDRQISISGRGALKLDSGELIENPAEMISDIFIHIQGYDASSIDTGELARFYADCLREEIRVACVFSEVVTIKNLLDELALNIHAQWMISDGKSVMRLKWL